MTEMRNGDSGWMGTKAGGKKSGGDPGLGGGGGRGAGNRHCEEREGERAKLQAKTGLKTHGLLEAWPL